MENTRPIAVTRRTTLLGALAMATVLTPAAATRLNAWETSMTKSTIDGPEGKLAANRMGDGGLPVLFLHGDSSRASQWDAVAAMVAEDREAVSFDFRGHGDSQPAANGDYSYDGRAEDVAAIADAFHLERFVIVAHSGGAGVALACATGNADRVAGILMVDPATDPRALPQEIRDGFVRDLSGPESLEVQKAYFASIAGPNADVRERVLADTALVDPAARAGVGKALATWNPEPMLDAYRGPMLVLVSEASDNAAALYRLRTDIPHQVVRGTGHWLMLDRPDVVADAVKAFVAKVEAGEPKG